MTTYHNTRKLSIHVEITNMQWLVNKWEFYFAIVLIFEKLGNLICSMNLPCYLSISFVNCVCVKSLSHVQLFVTPVVHRAPLSMDSPGKNTGVGCHFLLQGIFPTQGWNPSLLHCRQTLYPLSHQGSLLLTDLFTFLSFLSVNLNSELKG